jgi:periplasmic protein TonB
MSENRFLQSFCAVAASSVLVCGTLLLLTSTAPWTPPEIGIEPSTPDAAREMAETMPPLDIDVAEETVAALGSPLNAETADGGSDVGADDAEIAVTIAEPVLPIETNLSVAFSSPAPAGERTEAATDQIAGLLAGLPPRAISSDMSEAATEEVAALAAELPSAPPPVIASQKTEAAAEKVAGLAADLLPAPQPLTAREMAEPVPEVTAQAASTADPVIGESQVAETEFVDVTAAITAMPAAYVVAEHEAATFELASSGEPPAAEPLAAQPSAVESPAPAPMDTVERDVPELAVVELAPPPMPRRKPEMPAAPSVAELPAPEAVEAPPVKTATSTPAREKPAAAAQEPPKQATAQAGGGPFARWKPMALAPADQPVAPSRPATARPSSGAYASQVWSRLARHKPRAGQRGSASVSFAIGEMGALRGAQIARSSGNARIDQLALQTVRGAAPFPAPPAGAVSYTIRIHFQ